MASIARSTRSKLSSSSLVASLTRSKSTKSARTPRFTATTVTAPPSDSLLRTLVSLYHLTPSFISPQRLSTHIDETLTRMHPRPPHNLEYPTVRPAHTPDAAAARALLRPSAVIADGRAELDAEGEELQWTGRFGNVALEGMSERERAVRDALYGTDAGGAPGWELVREVEEREGLAQGKKEEGEKA